ncbi:hypothetical protein [Nonomuraea sp. NPDC050540]|uniref:hypothetical protein n=1 Tax=Nonomuraea sp. NPDC050540 TaxID=3364367 RepID=UPI0037BD2119
MTRTLVLVIDNDVLLVAIPSLTQELGPAPRMCSGSSTPASWKARARCSPQEAFQIVTAAA